MTVLTRKALYERIWAEPVRTVAHDLGVSDVALRKSCLNAQIPVPERGYWARLRAGRTNGPMRLPPRGPGMPDKVRIGESYGYGYGSNKADTDPDRPPPLEPVFDETIESVRERVVQRVGKVRYERDFKSPHPLIRALLADDETRRLKSPDAPWRLKYSEPLFASAFERRRLRVLNSLFIALHAFGAQPWVSDGEARKTGVVVGVERVGFLLDHPSAKPDRDGQWKTREGWADELRLTLEGEGARAWADTEEHGLEAFLTDIVVQLIVAGELRHRSCALAERAGALKRREERAREAERRRIEAVRRAREERIAADKARRAELLRLAADLRAADDIRALAARVVAQRGAESEALASWAAWALQVADRLDPVARLVIDEAGRAGLADPEWPAPADGESREGPG